MVPLLAIFRKRQPFALHGVRNQAVRLAAVLHRMKIVQQRAHIVAIQLAYFPAERFPLVAQAFQRHDIFRGSADLQPVAVDNRKQIIQLVIGARHSRFPNAAFGLFAVTHQHKRAVGFVQPFGRDGHANAYRQPVPQRAGAHFHAGRTVVGVPNQAAARLRKCPQFLFFYKAPIRQQGQVTFHAMALGEQKAIPVRPFGILWANIQHIIV